MAEELKIIIEADVTKAQEGLNQVANSAQKTADSFNKITPAANNASAAITSVVTKPLAPVVNLTQGVSKLGDTIETLRAKALVRGDLIATEKDVAKIAILNKEIVALEAEIRRVQNIGKEGITTEFSGLIGGANQAFTVLRKIAFILPGIGIAGIFNLAFEAIQSFTGGLNKSDAAVEKAKKDFDDLKKSIDDLKSVSQIKIEAIGGTQGDIENVVALASAVRDTNLSYDERKRALAQLQQANKSYFGDITLETSSMEKLTQRVNEYTDALIQAAVVKGFENEISKIAPELGKLNKAFNDSQDNIDKLKKSLADLSATKVKEPEVILPGGISGANVTNQLSSQTAAELKLAQSIQEETKKRDELGDVLQKTRSDYADLQDAIHGAVLESLKFKPLNVDTTGVQRGLSEIQRRTIELAKLLQDSFNVPVDLRFAIDDTSQKQFDKAKEILKGIEDHTIRLKIIVPDKIELPELKPRLDEPGFKKELDDLVGKLNANLKALLVPKSFLEQLDGVKSKLSDIFKFDPTDINKSLSDASKLILNNSELENALKLSLTLDIDPVKFDQSLNKIKQNLPESLKGKLDIALEVGDIQTVGLLQAIANMNDQINKAIDDGLKNISTEGLSSIGEAIGAALSGGDIANVFKQFGDTLGSAVEALGKQIIGLGVAALLTKRALVALFANPALAIAAGIALVAIGAAIKNLLGSGLKGFEKGGRPVVGEWVIVGEKGPELFKADKPGTIFSNQQSKSILSSSVTENNSIKEYLITSRINQTLKEHTSHIYESIKESIKIALVPIHSRLSETIQSIATSNEKLTAYKLHEVNDSETLKESFKTLSESITKVFDKVEVKNLTSTGIPSNKFTNKFSNSSEKTSERIQSSFIEKISKYFDRVTERIIINNFHFKESFSTEKLSRETFSKYSLQQLQHKFNIPAFASGGAVFGPTLAILGEGFGISRSNPEFVGTASQLKGIQGGSFDVNVNVNGDISFDMGKLAVALNRQERSHIRTNGKKPF